MDVYFDRLLEVASSIGEPSDDAFHLGVGNLSFPTIRIFSHKIGPPTRTSSEPPLEPFSDTWLTRFVLSISNLIQFPQTHRLSVYAGAIYIPPPMDVRHWFDQPILAPYDDYVFDVAAFVIDTATNQSLPILKLSAADPTDNFYADDQTDWDTESTFNGVRVLSRHLEMRIKRSSLSKIFTIFLLLINWFLTAGCLRITLLSVVGHREMGEGVLLLPITVILTIPALRALYVGSPPFGTYLGKHLMCSPQ